MSSPLLLPTTRLVAQAWLRLAVPGVRVGDRVPAVDEEMRTDGFIRVAIFPGRSDPNVPMHGPSVVAECWLAPDARSQKASWTRVEQLGARIHNASYDPALMGVLIDLSSVGDYGNARVHTVTAPGDPERVEDDPNDFARVDVLLAPFLWSATA